MKQESVKVGAIYKTRTFHGIHPYAKFLAGVGELYFPDRSPTYFPGYFPYTQDRFTTYGMGGGVEYRVWKTMAVRADYEYEFYEKFMGNGALNPNGDTVGVTYYLRGVHRHY